MTFASLRAAAQEAVKAGTLLPHQLAALQWADEQLTDKQKEGFTDLWRAKGSPAAPAPAKPKVATPQPWKLAPIKSLLEFIYSGEGGYSSVNRGKAGDTPGGAPELTKLTIGQVKAAQKAGKWFAVGAAQFIPTTLPMAQADAGLPDSALFNPENQDRLATALLLGRKRPKLAAYLTGKSADLDAAQTDMALEWASVPGPDGRGAYDGDSAGNRATKKVEAVRKALTDARAALGGLPLQQPARPSGAAQPYLRLTRSGRKDNRGLDILNLHRMQFGAPVGVIGVVSGAPGAQAFRTGAASRTGSLEPLPEGRYAVGDIDWAAGKDNYQGSFGPGLGPVWVPLEYAGPGRTARSAIGAHIDHNREYNPGSAGCVVFNNLKDLQAFVAWLRADNPRTLLVDWGLGTCPKAP